MLGFSASTGGTSMKGTDFDARIVTVDAERATARVDTRAGAPRRRTADTAGMKVLTNAMVEVGEGGQPAAETALGGKVEVVVVGSEATWRRWRARWMAAAFGGDDDASKVAPERWIASCASSTKPPVAQTGTRLGGCPSWAIPASPPHAGAPLPPPPRGTERPTARVQRVAADWRRAAAHPAAGVRRLGRASESRAAGGDQATSPDQPTRLCRHNCGGWRRWVTGAAIPPSLCAHQSSTL